MSNLSITDSGFFDLLNKVCENCPIDFKLGMMIPYTVGYRKRRKNSATL